MIVQWRESRLNIDTYTDSRLKNAQGRYCLCTLCTKTSLDTDADQSRVCKKHEEFIENNKKLQLSAPVFACPEFQERPEHEDLLLLGLRREMFRSTDEELMFVSNSIQDYLRTRQI